MHSRHPRWHRLTSVIALLLGSAACSPGAPPEAPASDPSSPRAAEGTVPALPSTSTSASASTHVTYVCPMHAEVTSSEPGTCPKCHMTLVPAK